MKKFLVSLLKLFNQSSFERILNFLSKIHLSKQLQRKTNFASVISSNTNSANIENYFINLVLKSLRFAFDNKIKNFNRKLKHTKLFNIFPGKHYRLLNAIAKIRKPKVIVEIGTFTGMSAFAFFKNHKGVIYSFDLKSYKSFQNHIDKNVEKRFIQFLVDLSKFINFKKYQNILNKADIIFLDAPKDGFFEYKLIKFLTKLKKKKKKILIIDDIKFYNMLNLWDKIESPKIDLTSLSHWSGTGIVDISETLEIKK